LFAAVEQAGASVVLVALTRCPALDIVERLTSAATRAAPAGIPAVRVIVDVGLHGRLITDSMRMRLDAVPALVAEGHVVAVDTLFRDGRRRRPSAAAVVRLPARRGHRCARRAPHRRRAGGDRRGERGRERGRHCVSTVRLLRGEDESLLSSALGDTIHELVGDSDRSLAVDELDGDDYSASAIVDAAQTPPFLTERRVVWPAHRSLRRRGPGVARRVACRPAAHDRPGAHGGRRCVPKALLGAVKNAGGVVVDTDAPSGRKERPWLDDTSPGPPSGSTPAPRPHRRTPR
jgi:hypothetical protein